MNNFEIVGVDTGGTFVDIVARGERGFVILKIPSTPDHPSDAVVSGLNRLEGRIDEVIHGTTVATNAVIERKGARVVLLTTKGFRDVLVIGRQNRRDIYELVPSRPEELVPEENRIEVDERVLSDGTVETQLTEEEIMRVLTEIPRDTEAVAVCYLFSFTRPEHELLTKQKIQEEMDILVTTSYEVFPEYREYERTSTTVMDAYIKPLMTRYVDALKQEVLESQLARHLVVMKSSRGLATLDGVLRKPVDTLVSGLAGGVLAAELTAELTGVKNLISVDIGGTSTDVAQVWEGQVNLNHSMEVDGLPVGIETVDVQTIGAGGGSIARVKAGLLRVGPESAAGKPGPAAYGMGGRDATVTDADLLFGVLGVNLAGGQIVLQPELAMGALEEIAGELGVSTEDAVRGIRRVFHENIAAALRSVSTNRGVDPRDYAIVAFGGAGPVHGAEVAELLGITKVIIPPFPGTWSAFGLLGADYQYEASRGRISALKDISLEEITGIFRELRELNLARAEDDGVLPLGEVGQEDTVDVRFLGQSYELTIPWEGGVEELHERFLHQHKEVYGFAPTDQELEVVALRSRLVIPHTSPELPRIEETEDPKPSSTREILGIGEVPVYLRQDIGLHQMEGPMIIEQLDSTVWVPPRWKMKQTELGFIVMEVSS